VKVGPRHADTTVWVARSGVARTVSRDFWAPLDPEPWLWWSGRVHETDEDIAQLQRLLDESDERAGSHLREVIAAERRLSARATCDRLVGMRLLALATVSGDGRPFVGPVDGIFFRGAFHCSSSPDSLRVRHIRARPFVSATHLPSEEFAVTVHGVAEILDITAPEHAQLRETILNIYTPTYGEDWYQFLEANVVMRIHARRMFTFHLESI